MKSRFHPPSRSTKTKFFGSPALLSRAIAGTQTWIVLDSGVPIKFLPKSRGIFRLNGGEDCKRWAELEKLLGWLAAQKAERGHTLLVMGGGATLDLGAFAAALYRRGMRLVFAPTSLLGMVDASLGGKTAVDLELNGRLTKNFAGTFYVASDVWISSDFLGTLPPRERISGAGEVCKSLWLKGKKWNPQPILDFVETGRPTKSLIPLIRACLEFKSRLVERDPLDENRIREALNFGHTVGHALESASGLSHGECVLWGMAVETTLLKAKGNLMAAECQKMIRALKLSLPEELLALPHSEWLPLLNADKKNKDGKIAMSLLERPGKIVKKKFTAAQLARAIKEFPGSFQRGAKHQQV